MNRKELLSKLEIIEPALAKASIVPVMSHVWFTGTHMMAFNDTIAISLPFETSFKCAVPGETLIKFLSASLAKEVDLTPGENSLKLKAAGARLTMPLLPEDKFIFTMPTTTKIVFKPDQDHAIFAAMEDCLLSINKPDYMQPDTLGITIIREGSKALLFSTNRETISHSRTGDADELEMEDNDRAILPTSFCEQMIKWAKLGKDLYFKINMKGHAIFRADDVTIFCKLVENDKPLDYISVVERMVPKNLEGMIPIPTKFGMIMDRALIIADDKDEAKMRIEISKANSMATCELASSKGELLETMPVKGHEDCVGTLRPKYVKPGTGFEKMLMTDKCLIMSKSKTLYMVSTTK